MSIKDSLIYNIPTLLKNTRPLLRRSSIVYLTHTTLISQQNQLDPTTKQTLAESSFYREAWHVRCHT